jgi:hypothetical protein
MGPLGESTGIPYSLVHEAIWCAETVCKPSSEASEAAYHQADHRQGDERFTGGAQALIVLAEPALLALPSKRSFHHPPSRQHREARRQIRGTNQSARGGRVAGTQTLEGRRRCATSSAVQRSGLLDPVLAFPLPVGAALEPDMTQPWKLPGDRFVQHQLDAVAVHEVGGMDDRAQHEAFGIHEQVALASFDLLATVKAALPTNAGGLHGLTVNAARAGLGVTAEAPTEVVAQQRVHALPRSITPPASQAGLHGLPGRPLLGQEAPGAASAELVKQGVEDGAQGVQGVQAGATDGRLRRQEGFEQGPFGVGEIRGIAPVRGVHPPAYLTPLPAW